MKEFDIFKNSQDIFTKLSSGIVLSTKADGKLNSMIIGWLQIGVFWGKPIITIFVKGDRFTKKQLDTNPEFTLSLPSGTQIDEELINIFGRETGRDTDKISTSGITIVEPLYNNVFAIKELPFTIECKVIYNQDMVLDNIPESIRVTYYPNDSRDNSRHIHTVYFGEVIGSYILE